MRLVQTLQNTDNSEGEKPETSAMLTGDFDAEKIKCCLWVEKLHIVCANFPLRITKMPYLPSGWVSKIKCCLSIMEKESKSPVTMCDEYHLCCVWFLHRPSCGMQRQWWLVASDWPIIISVCSDSIMPTLRHHQVSRRHVSRVGQSCKYLDKALIVAFSLWKISLSAFTL